MENLLSHESRHPGDVFFEKIGLPENFGEKTIPYHGRLIERRDYFFQPDVHPLAKLAFEKLSAMDEQDPKFPSLMDAFLAGAAPYLGID